jgi:hypothetical protein
LINDFIEIAKLIGKFQALETGLKIVLVMHEIAEDKKNDKLKDDYSLREVDELSFGILLKRYKKVSGNKEFYDRLVVLKDYRNFLAHKSLLAVSSMPKEMKEFVGIFTEPLDYSTLNQELDDCIMQFSKQYQRGEV